METAYPRPRTKGLGRRAAQVHCKLCKRRQVPWKDPRGRPYEKVAIKCDHDSSVSFKPTSGKCHLRLQEDGEGRKMGRTSLECRPALSWLPTHDTAATVVAEATRSQTPLILRVHCQTCHIAGVACSGSVTGTRCERCEELDLECDCRVLRRGCENCMKEREMMVWGRCVGFHDACDSCIEKRIECKEYVRGSQSQSSEKKKSKDDAMADGTMHIVNGMKAKRAFTACERCSEKKLRCDETVSGCGSCTEKGAECRYRLFSTASSDFSGRRQKKVWGSSFSVDLEESEEAGYVEIPWTRDPDTKTLEARAERSRNDHSVDGVGKLMSDLELGGWHFVSREEVDEAVEVSNGRT